MKRIFIPIATLLAGCAGGYLIGSTGPGIGRGQATMWAPVPINITETITVRDTLQIHVPGATMRVAPARTVTIPAQWATVHRDSDSLTVKAQTRVYSCSTFRAVVSGVRPSLDSLTLYRSSPVITRTVTIPQPSSRWGIGVTAGVTATSRGLAPGVTVGITYRLWPK